ncbi:MAG: hypothetical protein OES09_04870 [Gammaproteobacteria bacterium]|nr:hypothetical protein [Gammaproteobacteria bacterium]
MSRSEKSVWAAVSALRGAWAPLVAGGLLTACAATPPAPPVPPVEPPPILTPGQSSSGTSQTGTDRSPAPAPPTDADAGATAGIEEAGSVDAAGADGKQTGPGAEPGGARESDPVSEPADSAGSTSVEALTDSERISHLDDRLERGLGEFDGLILREQLGVRTRTQEQGADLPQIDNEQFEAEGGGSSGPVGTADSESDTGGAPSSGAGNQPDTPTPPRDGEFGGQQAAVSVPPDIPDGSDDDVVARQIREAAMREKDPELQKKLWDEYRKYKKRNR